MVRIETAELKHCREIAEIHVRSWQEAYKHLLPTDYLLSLSVELREATWRETVANGKPEVLVAIDGNQVTGFIAFDSSRDKDATHETAEIWAVYLAPLHWSRGIGCRLWLAAQERIFAKGFTSITLWVLAGNERAVRFYEKAGFRADELSYREIDRNDIRRKELRYVLSIHP